MVDVELYFRKEIRLVLIGKTGSGKSASGNTILGSEKFPSEVSASSVTSKCTRKKSLRFGKIIHIVDTPGLFDTERSNEETLREITRCIAITSPGPHAFILVLNISRYTAEEHQCVNHFIQHFGENIYKYFIILFTRKDDLDHEKRTLDDFIQSSSGNLKTFLDKCGRRVIAFNNRLGEGDRDKQVENLLKMIEGIKETNKGKCYTDAMYREAEKLLREKEQERLKQLEAEKKHEVQKIYSAHGDNEIWMKKIRDLEKRYETLYAKEREERRKEAEEGNGIFSMLYSFAKHMFSTLAEALLDKIGD